MYESVIFPIVLSLLVVCFLCLYLPPSVETTLLYCWAGSHFLVGLFRLSFFHFLRKKSPTLMHSTTGDRIFLLGALLAASLWGAGAFLIPPGTDQIKETTLLILLIGVSAAAIPALCSNWVAMVGFFSLVLLPLAFQKMSSHTEAGILLGGLVILFWAYCLVNGKKLYSNIKENIVLHLESIENEKTLQMQEDRYRHFFDNSPLGVLNYSPEFTIVDCNSIFAQIINKTPDQIVGLQLYTLFTNDELKTAIDLSFTQGNGFFEGELQSVDRQMPIPTRIHFKATTNQDGSILGGIATVEDLTERKTFEKKIEHQAHFDQLTNLPNRRHLIKILDKEISRATRHTTQGALLVLDIDNFKTINDSLGHSAGDNLIKHIANSLPIVLRQEDTTARMGGDEFAILLGHLDDNVNNAVEKAQKIGSKLNDIIKRPLHLEGHELNLTSSIGITLFPDQGVDAEDILKQADTAMSQAKSAGKNNIRFYLPTMQEEADKRLQLNNDIKKAISNNELSLHFQPQVQSSGDIVGAEGLLRWTHPERGNIPPGEFISIAEETGIIVEIGSWVLTQVCNTIKRWEDQGILRANQTIAVNISAKEFAMKSFVDHVTSIISKTGIDPTHLDIELTEGSLISSVDETIEKIKILREKGIKFSVDDFGTGYSSLSYLKSLPLHTLKIDRSFVSDISRISEDVRLVEIIISMAQKLGLNLVAEGVESEVELNYLEARGCDVFQGYYFSKPVPSEEFERLLAKGSL